MRGFAKRRSRSAPEILVEKVEGTLPGQLGRSLIVTRRCVIVKTVIHPLINVRGIVDMICLKHFLTGRPPPPVIRVSNDA
jgi:hypothetical protein